jgi:hypothetical protein
MWYIGSFPFLFLWWDWPEGNELCVHTACQHQIWIADVITFEEILSTFAWLGGNMGNQGCHTCSTNCGSFLCWSVGCDEASGQWGGSCMCSPCRFMWVNSMSSLLVCRTLQCEGKSSPLPLWIRLCATPWVDKVLIASHLFLFTMADSWGSMGALEWHHCSRRRLVLRGIL